MNLFGVQSHLYKKRLMATPLFYFFEFQVERETVIIPSLPSMDVLPTPLHFRTRFRFLEHD